MRKLFLLLLLAAIAFPAFAARRVTVEQLEQELAAAHGKPDTELARQLSDLELTERLNATRLSHLEADLPGTDSKQALTALADVSAFLDLPPTEIPDIPVPEIPAQRQLMAQTIDYVEKTISKLPNFFATRVTIHFEDTQPQGYEKGLTVATLYQPLHTVGTSTVNVLYSDGQEVVDTGPKGKKPGSTAQGLTTSGEFGPILAMVLVDAAQGKLMWSHWEQSAVGPRAVFRYTIPKEKSHYQIQFCCVPGDNGNRVFQEFSGYHGEITVDPKDGTILRLTLEADLKPTDPIVMANMLVEYGPVEIGGKSYLCPVKSVSVSKVQPLHSSLMQDPRTGNLTQDSQIPPGPPQTLVNDVAFERYHVFTASAHVLPAHNYAGENTSVSNLAKPIPSTANNSHSEDVASTPARNTTTPVSAESAPDAPITNGSSSSPAANTAHDSTAPEVSIADSAAPLDTSKTPRAALSGGSVPSQATTRLVDIDVIAYDKKNHPITDLTPEDFEIYDNGHKQAIRFFIRPVAATEEPAKAPTQFAYSNRRAASANAGGTQAKTIVFLIDASNLTWSDLTYVREQLLRFLRTLPANERVAIYVMQGHGYQVLTEGTADRSLLATKLSEWMPNSQELTRAQAEDRQQTDVTSTPSDLQTVSGTSSQAPNSGTLVDPALRQIGGNPTGDTLSMMVPVARHLAAIPGHKNLVWITSDIVLTDSGNKSGNAANQNKRMSEFEFVLRAHEAMNDAHVSVYPLDASQPKGPVNVEVHPEADVAQTTNLPTSANMPHSPDTVNMQPDLHPIQGPMRDVADATGGRAIPRTGDLTSALNKVVEDGNATYLLSFTPDDPADGQYHTLSVKPATRRGATLRYRTGYQYVREPSTLKDRFALAIWQPFDMNEIGVSANPATSPTGAILKLNITTSDIALAPQEDRLVDNLDIFLIQREDDGLHAQVTGKILGLILKPPTYQKLLKEGIPFDQSIQRNQGTGSVRVVVVDENSGRMGSVTVPAAALQKH